MPRPAPSFKELLSELPSKQNFWLGVIAFIFTVILIIGLKLAGIAEDIIKGTFGVLTYFSTIIAALSYFFTLHKIDKKLEEGKKFNKNVVVLVGILVTTSIAIIMTILITNIINNSEGVLYEILTGPGAIYNAYEVLWSWGWFAWYAISGATIVLIKYAIDSL